jgi:CheY-like chemotaxis protein
LDKARRCNFDVEEILMAPKVLHVDDSEDMRVIVLLALETIGGLEVIQCSSGAEALIVAVSFQPDLFLLDVMMPDLTGPQTLLRLREMPQFSATPVIFLTAKAGRQDIVDLMAEGALEVITKPFDPMTISEQIVAIWKKSMRKATQILP